MQTQATQYHRWERGRSEPIKAWTPADFAYLLGLYRHRKLPSDILHALVRPTVTQFVTNRRLRRMHSQPNAILDWPEQQKAAYNANYRPRIFSLNPKGLALLVDTGALTPEAARWYEARRRAEHRPEFEHELMVDVIGALIELSANRRSLALASWPDILAKAPARTRSMAKPLSMPVAISHRFENHRKSIDTTITPDALFGLGYGHGWRFFALEADRATETIRPSAAFRNSYLRKLLGYQEILARHVYQEQFGLPKFGFYVLTVTTSEARLESIRALVEEVVARDWRRFFLFKAVPQFRAFERTPLPTLDLLATPWQRAKGEPLDIGKP